MRRTNKVVLSPAVASAASGALLNYDTTQRGVIVGQRSDSGATGFVGKIIEQSAGTNLLDYGVWVDLTYPHVVGVFGTRGTGKSFDLGVFAECVTGIGRVCSGTPPRSAIVLFDIQNQFWTLGLTPSDTLPEDSWQIAALKEWGLETNEVPSVDVWYPADTQRWLPTAKRFTISPNYLSPSDWLSLLRLERFSPMGQALLTVLQQHGSATPSTLAELVTEHHLPDFQAATIDGLRWRLESLSATAIVGEGGLDLDSLLQPGKVSVLLLRSLPEELRALVVGVVTRKLADRMSGFHQEARVARRLQGDLPSDDLPERLWVFLDEAHVIVPQDGSTVATAAMIDYAKRGRDAGLSLVFATQQPSAVDNRLMSQVDLTVTHTLSFEADLQAAVARMPTRANIKYSKAGLQLPTLTDALRSLGPGEAVIADAMNGRVFIIQFRPRVTAHGGNTPVTEDITN